MNRSDPGPGPRLGAAVLSVAAGAIVWAGLSLAAGGREAWDTPAYWLIGIPVFAVVAAVAGYLAPVRVWRWPVWMALGQMVTLFLIRPGTGLGLFPLALLFVGLPMVVFLTVPALIGGAIARRGWDRALLA